jgi:hypothetical protein
MYTVNAKGGPLIKDVENFDGGKVWVKKTVKMALYVM